MKELVKKIFRSIQVYFPFLQDFRFTAQMKINRMLRKPHEHDFALLRKFPLTGPLSFVDIGTNRGEAIQSMLSVHKHCTIVGFEPNPIIFKKAATLYKDFKQVKLHNCGLGKERGVFTLYLPFFRNFMFDGLASFNRSEAAGWLKDRIFGYRAERLRIREIACELKRLDDFNLSPHFIKIDVQGFEYEVLEGALETLKKTHPVLLIETPSEQATGLLNRLGYKAYYYKRRKLRRGRGKLNTYFVDDERISQLPLA
ncbi:MAG TPA: FkbM family methyltransferase [Chitinophagaceae bacterium]|nr:FkbM family methyltransferase [Chitinophagaceae bacterium]